MAKFIGASTLIIFFFAALASSGTHASNNDLHEPLPDFPWAGGPSWADGPLADSPYPNWWFAPMADNVVQEPMGAADDASQYCEQRIEEAAEDICLKKIIGVVFLNEAMVMSPTCCTTFLSMDRGDQKCWELFFGGDEKARANVRELHQYCTQLVYSPSASPAATPTTTSSRKLLSN